MDSIIAVLVAANTMTGAGTTYGEPYIGRPLFCSTPDQPLFYDRSTPPFVAFPLSWYKLGYVQCGDYVIVREHLPDGTTRALYAFALDAGPFGAHCIQRGAEQCQPIIVDVPIYYATWPGLSNTGYVEVSNVSAVVRACRERGYCD